MNRRKFLKYLGLGSLVTTVPVQSVAMPILKESPKLYPIPQNKPKDIFPIYGKTTFEGWVEFKGIQDLTTQDSMTVTYQGVTKSCQIQQVIPNLERNTTLVYLHQCKPPLQGVQTKGVHTTPNQEFVWMTPEGKLVRGILDE